MEEKAKIVDDSASNFVIGSAKDIKQSFGRRHFAELIPVPASLSVNEKSNDVPAFKASPMPKFASAHAYWDQWNDFRQKSVQFTLPQTPELMKRPRNKVNNYLSEGISHKIYLLMKKIVSIQGGSQSPT